MYNTQDDLRQLLLQEDEDVGRGWTVGDDDDEQEEDDQYASLVCDVCDQGNDEALMLLCDGMDSFIIYGSDIHEQTYKHSRKKHTAYPCTHPCT